MSIAGIANSLVMREDSLWHDACIERRQVDKPLLWIAMQGIPTPAAREILRYFLSHPDAADSVIEIARWRLAQERIRNSVEVTVATMQWLLSEGYLQEGVRQGTERIFQLNPEMRIEAERALQETTDEMNGR